ncbi:MAG: energy transducer TonB [Acidobacteriaceae bacterium]
MFCGLKPGGYNGRKRKVGVGQTAGAELDAAAEEAVKQWRYTPFIMCGQPIEVEIEITLHFTMNGR